MRLATLFLAALTVPAWVGCIPFASVTTSPALEGLVVEAETGDPVSNAYVTVPDFDVSVVTDSAGRFAIPAAKKRTWIAMIQPGSHPHEFRVRAWHGDGAIGEGYSQARSFTSSFGYSDVTDVLVLLAGEALEPHPAFEGCPFTTDRDYVARIAGGMDSLLSNPTFLSVWTEERSWRLLYLLREEMERAAEVCEARRDEILELEQHIYERGNAAL